MANNFDEDVEVVHTRKNQKEPNKAKVFGQTFMNNPKFRFIYVLMILLIIGIFIVGYFNLNNSLTKKSGSTANIQISGPSGNIVSMPGTSTSNSYNKLQDEENKIKAQQAKENGGSYISTPINNINSNIKDPFEDITEEYKQKEVVKPMEDVKVPDIQMPEPKQQPVFEQKQPEPVVYEEPETNYTNVRNNDRRNDAMSEQFNIYIAKWAANKSYQEKTVDASLERVGNMRSNTNTNSNSLENSISQSNSVAGAGKPASFVKAGTIIPAQLLTAINSDEPGPVMAEVSTGPLRGARLIGEVTHSNQAVVVRFGRITMQDQNQSYNINAYAVDTGTYRTFLASDVDNHYFLRYGLRLAAAFVEGYGDAVASSGATTTTSPFGSTTSILGDYSNSQIAKMSIGKLGQQLGREIDNSTSGIKPTVTVNGGLPIGVLFIADF